MRCFRLPALLAVCAILLTPAFASDSNTDNKIFTITVAPPTLPKDVQLRYFLSGEFGGFISETTATGKAGQIIIRTEHDNQAATSFRGVAYAPGCQFVTITVDNLTGSNREAEFQCQHLPTTLLQGRIPLAGLEGKDLQVEVLDACNWALRLLKIADGGVSPLVLTKVHVATDGTFAADVPDFAADPLWPSLAQDALIFYLIDAGTGNHLATLVPPQDISVGNMLKVAGSYPGEIQFKVQSDSSGQKP